MHTLRLFVAAFLAAASVFLAGCGKTVPAKEMPKAQVLFFCDRTKSTGMDWNYHAGMIQVVMSTLEYERRFDTKIFTFADRLGIAYEGSPDAWKEVASVLQDHVTKAGPMASKTSLGVPPTGQALKLVKINPDHPYMIVMLTDGELNDYGASKKLLQQLTACDNVRKLIVGPLPKDPVQRYNVEGNLFPFVTREEQVIVRNKDDIEPALREAAEEFNQKYLPATE